MAQKYYAVKQGVTPGIYFNWDDCKKMVDGYPGAIYKSFKTIQEAEAFIGGATEVNTKATTTKVAVTETGAAVDEDMPYAFVDGSFNSVTGTYGYGGFLIANGNRYQLQGAGDDEEMASMRNVAGEILGSQAAIEKAIEIGLDQIKIYYDYMGIEMWATGAWKRNKGGTIAYYDFIQSIKNKINIVFVKVKGHSGVEGNEEADELAKQAVGIL